MTTPQNKNIRQRPPIVVVMGHVDHGKTTLLDYIRKSSYDAKAASVGGEPRSVAEREAGGITQAVGAYEIAHNGRKITFIDTPGHEAFTKMRSRGAEVANLAILVVAVEEGVKPQTKEAIRILNDAKTPFIVAITKIDRPGADIEKIKNDLTANGVLLEGYGGQISYHGVSSKTGEGVNELLDLIILASDVENLTYDPLAPASGYILESKRDPRRGIEATAILKNGTLRRGDLIRTPTMAGKIKILEDFRGKTVDSLEPSAPAVIMGFENLPQVGEEFSTGEPVAGESTVAVKQEVSVGQAAKNSKGLRLALKASDTGSLEALSSVIKALSREENPIYEVNESVGDITDGDIKNAIATGAVVVGFKNKVDRGANNLAVAHSVKVITSGIIYELVKYIEDFLSGRGDLAEAGRLEVLAVFNQEKTSEQLMGGRVTRGEFRDKATFVVLRKTGSEEEAVGSGRIISLKEKKSEITQATVGEEIGILANSPVVISIGDNLVIKKT
ncbi:MAG: translation initiation factor IF-2 [Patescibacteria group bacterium]